MREMGTCTVCGKEVGVKEGRTKFHPSAQTAKGACAGSDLMPAEPNGEE